MRRPDGTTAILERLTVFSQNERRNQAFDAVAGGWRSRAGKAESVPASLFTWRRCRATKFVPAQKSREAGTSMPATPNRNDFTAEHDGDRRPFSELSYSSLLTYRKKGASHCFSDKKVLQCEESRARIPPTTLLSFHTHKGTSTSYYRSIGRTHSHKEGTGTRRILSKSRLSAPFHLPAVWPLETRQQRTRQPADLLYHAECTLRGRHPAPGSFPGIPSCLDDIDHHCHHITVYVPTRSNCLHHVY